MGTYTSQMLSEKHYAIIWAFLERKISDIAFPYYTLHSNIDDETFPNNWVLKLRDV